MRKKSKNYNMKVKTNFIKWKVKFIKILRIITLTRHKMNMGSQN